jgi:hypothetical protein
VAELVDALDLGSSIERCGGSQEETSDMQTVETLNEGLKRAFMLTIPAEDIEARVDGR